MTFHFRSFLQLQVYIYIYSSEIWIWDIAFIQKQKKLTIERKKSELSCNYLFPIKYSFIVNKNNYDWFHIFKKTK